MSIVNGPHCLSQFSINPFFFKIEKKNASALIYILKLLNIRLLEKLRSQNGVLRFTLN